MSRPFLLLLAALFALPAQAAATASAGNLEMHCIALPSTELTEDAVRRFNVSVAPDRAVVKVTLLRKGRNGQMEAVPGQVYVGAIDQRNQLSSIPMRELRDADSVRYLGEFRIEAPNTLRFLVSANVLGKPLKLEFSRSFPAP